MQQMILLKVLSSFCNGCSSWQRGYSDSRGFIQLMVIISNNRKFLHRAKSLINYRSRPENQAWLWSWRSNECPSPLISGGVDPRLKPTSEQSKRFSSTFGCNSIPLSHSSGESSIVNNAEVIFDNPSSKLGDFPLWGVVLDELYEGLDLGDRTCLL